MAQNREPPAYLEYAATILANRQYRSMTLAERGLLYSMRLECWENKQVPASTDELAEYIGCDVADVKAALTDRVKSFLSEKDGSLTCPELDDYRQHLEDRRLKQSTGGKSGSAITNANRKKLNCGSSNLQAPRRGSVESLVKSSSVKSSQVQSLETGVIDDPFVRDYERASNGE
jgi:hypothetical protein